MHNQTSAWQLGVHCLISYAIFQEELLFLSFFTDYTGRCFITFDAPLNGRVHVFPSAFFLLRDFFMADETFVAEKMKTNLFFV